MKKSFILRTLCAAAAAATLSTGVLTAKNASLTVNGAEQTADTLTGVERAYRPSLDYLDEEETALLDSFPEATYGYDGKAAFTRTWVYVLTVMLVFVFGVALYFFILNRVLTRDRKYIVRSPRRYAAGDITDDVVDDLNERILRLEAKIESISECVEDLCALAEKQGK